MQQLPKLRDERSRRTFGNLQRHLLNPRTPDESECLLHTLRRERALRECRTLVENRECVTHTAVRLHGNDGERILIRRNARLVTDVNQTIANLRHRNPMEVVALTP